MRPGAGSCRPVLLKYGWHPSTHTLESRRGCLCASLPNSNRAPSFASVEGHRRGGFLRSSFLSGEAAVATTTSGHDDVWHPSASWSLRGLSHTCALRLPLETRPGDKALPLEEAPRAQGPMKESIILCCLRPGSPDTLS